MQRDRGDRDRRVQRTRSPRRTKPWPAVHEVGVTQYVPRLPLSLDPLIAEARRRARQRRVLLAAIVLVFGLGAGGTTLLVHPFGWFRTSRPYTGPYEPGGIFRGLGGLGPADSWPGVQAVSAASRSDAWIVGSGGAALGRTGVDRRPSAADRRLRAIGRGHHRSR